MKKNSLKIICLLMIAFMSMAFSLQEIESFAVEGDFETDISYDQNEYDEDVISGVVFEDDEWHYYSEDGTRKTGTGWISIDGTKTYYLKKGVLVTGWLAYDKKAYYFYEDTIDDERTVCKRAYDYDINSNITVGEKGYFSGKRGEAYYYMIKRLNEYGWTLKGAYKASYKIKYANRSYRSLTAARAAIYFGKHQNGNCYVMNSCFHIMADLLGYKVRQIKGSVGWWKAPHSWLEIKQDGKWWVYDANFRNETGKNGFKIKYGQKNTWKYNRTSNYLKKY